MNQPIFCNTVYWKNGQQKRIRVSENLVIIESNLIVSSTSLKHSFFILKSLSSSSRLRYGRLWIRSMVPQATFSELSDHPVINVRAKPIETDHKSSRLENESKKHFQTTKGQRKQGMTSSTLKSHSDVVHIPEIAKIGTCHMRRYIMRYSWWSKNRRALCRRKRSWDLLLAAWRLSDATTAIQKARALTAYLIRFCLRDTNKTIQSRCAAS